MIHCDCGSLTPHQSQQFSRKDTMRFKTSAAAAAAAVLAIAPATATAAPDTDAAATATQHASVWAPHVADRALADAAAAVSRVDPGLYGQPDVTDKTITDTLRSARPALVEAANTYRDEHDLPPLGQSPALDEYAQARADMLARGSRAVAVPTRPVYESVTFVPDNPARVTPRMWQRSPLADFVLTNPRAGVGAVGISYAYLPLRGWGYIIVLHTAPAGTDF